VIDLTSLREGAQRFMKDNATTILTGTGVVGTVATAVLTAKASFAASEKLILEEANYAVEHDGHGGFNTKDKIKVVWPLYIPPVAVGSATVASIVLANRMSAQRAAALAAAYGLAESRLQEYRGKVLEVGWNQATTGPVELRFSTVRSPDEKPCIAFDFIVPPRPDYSQLY
jgi:hypothetical protein